MIIGIGVDIVDLKRIKKHEQRLSKKSLFEDEYKEYLKRINRLEYLAGRLAAKEACYKALPSGTVNHFLELEIKVKDKQTYYENKDYLVMISISHDGDYAIAYANCFRKNNEI